MRAGRYTLNGKYDAASFPDSVKEIGFIKSHGEVDALITMDGEHCVFFRSSSLPTGMFVPGSFGKLTYEWHEANMGTASPNRIKIFVSTPPGATFLMQRSASQPFLCVP